MKRYLVFSNGGYYPNGGWGDFKGSFDTLEEAITSAKIEAKKNSAPSLSWWWHVVEITLGEEVTDDTAHKEPMPAKVTQ